MSPTGRLLIVMGLLITGLAVVSGSALWLALANRGPAQAAFPEPVATPMMGRAERFECPRALKKDIIWLGVEDGFERASEELARPRDAIMQQAFFGDVFSGKNLRYRYRDFDELGVDRTLYVSVSLPPHIERGFVIGRVLIDDPVESDFISFSDLTNPFTSAPSESHTKFVAPLNQAQLDFIPGSRGDLVLMDFDMFVSRATGQPISLNQYLKDASNRDPSLDTALDITFSDDTAVDAMAIVMCLDKPEREGTTFTEIKLDLGDENLSLLSCGMDASQRPCDPFSGDTLCRMELPVACYSSSVRTDVATPVPNGIDRFARFRVEGRVRLSPEVRGDRFATREDVNEFCRNEFGDDHRILSFHESGAPGILSNSDIPPGQRAWIDVRDQPNGNCWNAGPADQAGEQTRFGTAQSNMPSKQGG